LLNALIDWSHVLGSQHLTFQILRTEFCIHGKDKRRWEELWMLCY